MGDAGDKLQRPAAARPSLRKSAMIVVKVAISAVLIGAVAMRVPFEKSLVLVSNISGRSLALVLLLLVIQFPIAAWRWSAVLEVCGVQARFGRLQNLVWINLFVNQVVPTFVIGDAVRAWYLFQDGNSSAKVIRGVLLDRIAGMAGLILLNALLSGVIVRRLPGSVGWGVALFALGCTAAMIGFLLGGRQLLKFFAIGRLCWFDQLINDAWRIVIDPPRLLLVGITSVGSYILASLATFLLASDLGIDLSFSNSMILIPVALLASIVPISFAGWGLREGAFVFLLSYVRIPAEQSLALSICYGGAVLLSCLPGGAIWLGLFLTKRSSHAR
jgi:glycosyltransferase 2 family protein